MERPLDTIRSFEAAVEGTYNDRRSTFSGRPGMSKTDDSARPKAKDQAASQVISSGASRRSSYFGGMLLFKPRFARNG